MPETFTAARDIPLIITSTASSSERRITPSWSIAQLKIKLEPVTGIPPSSQELTLRLPEQQQEIAIDAQDEATTQIGGWPLVAYAEIHVCPFDFLGEVFSACTSLMMPRFSGNLYHTGRMILY